MAKIPNLKAIKDWAIGKFQVKGNYLTSETDPTVPSWAKQSSKPTYTASEVGALPSNTHIPSALSELTQDTTHRVVTDAEKGVWSAKADVSDIPTNVSSFTNDSDYQSGTQVSQTVADAVGDITSFDYKIVDDLPISGVKGTIYMLPKTDEEEQNVYSEFLWIDNKWESIGDTKVDLSDYTKTEDLADVALSGSASDITADATHRFVTDTEKTSWNSSVKQQIFDTYDEYLAQVTVPEEGTRYIIKNSGSPTVIVPITGANYDALGDKVNTDGIIYIITDRDSQININARTVSYDNAQNNTRPNNVQGAIDTLYENIVEQGTVVKYPQSNVSLASGTFDATDQILICNHVCMFRLGITNITINGSTATIATNMPKAAIKNQAILCRFRSGSTEYLHQMQIMTDGTLRNLYPITTYWNDLTIVLEGQYFTSM